MTQPQTPEQIMAGIMADPRMARNATWRPFLSAVAEEVLAAARNSAAQHCWHGALGMDREESPLARNPLQGVFASILELDAGSRREVRDGARDHRLRWPGEGSAPAPITMTSFPLL